MGGVIFDWYIFGAGWQKRDIKYPDTESALIFGRINANAGKLAMIGKDESSGRHLLRNR